MTLNDLEETRDAVEWALDNVRGEECSCSKKEGRPECRVCRARNGLAQAYLALAAMVADFEKYVEADPDEAHENARAAYADLQNDSEAA